MKKIMKRIRKLLGKPEEKLLEFETVEEVAPKSLLQMERTIRRKKIEVRRANAMKDRQKRKKTKRGAIHRVNPPGTGHTYQLKASAGRI